MNGELNYLFLFDCIQRIMTGIFFTVSHMLCPVLTSFEHLYWTGEIIWSLGIGYHQYVDDAQICISLTKSSEVAVSAIGQCLDVKSSAWGHAEDESK